MTERVLVICAHPDDEVLGCGGTIARHVSEGDDVHVLYAADGETSRTIKVLPNRNIMAFNACKLLGVKSHVFFDYADQRLDDVMMLDLTQRIEAEVEKLAPTVVYTHHAADLNLDHCLVHRAVMTALRPLPGTSCKAIYTFEVPSSTEWGSGFCPNYFVDILPFIQLKQNALVCYHKEMRDFPHPRSYVNVDAMAKVRGSTVGLQYAEAFMTMRSVR